MAMTVGGMLAIAAYTLLDRRERILENSFDISAMHTHGIEEFVTQSLFSTELLAINTLSRETALPDVRYLASVFATSLRHAPFLRSLSLLDDRGHIVASSNPANLRVKVATEAFLPQVSGAAEILRIGQPWVGRDFADGRPVTGSAPRDEAAGFIPVARTVTVGDQAVTLLVALNTDYFVNYISQKLDPQDGVVQVLRYDGILLMDTRPGALRTFVVEDLRLDQREFGHLERDLGSGYPEPASFRSSRLYPFVVVTRLNRERALQQWRAEAGSLLGVLIPALVAITLLAIVYYRRQLQFAEQRARAERLERVNAASVFTNAREGIMITEADGTVTDVNDSFTRITGYTRSEVLGQNPRLLRSGRHDIDFYASMWRDLLDKGHWKGEIWNRRKDGTVYAEMLTISAVRDERGETRQFVALFSDITKLKDHARQLELVAHYDALTKLPNRVLLGDRMVQAMVQTLRRGNRLAVTFLDLDGFKSINDLHGHDVGDQLLVTVAGRMKHTLREGDTLARLGGDEFVAVLLDLDDQESSRAILDRLLAAAAQPVVIGDRVLRVSASLGVSFFPQDGDVDPDQLLRQADQAMYRAKLAGKGRYHVFDPAEDRDVRGRHERIEDIRRALRADKFVLYYQPKVNMRTGAILGAEALIRWQHPERGVLSPGEFLPLIEDHELNIELGEWVIESALAQIAEWHRAGLSIGVSVNLAAVQLQQAGFVERLESILAKHPQVRRGQLELEVLETSALDDLAHVSVIMDRCRQLGVVFSLDDFGTGYSSLTYLKRLPVTQIKIDQSFVRDMLDDVDDLAILDGVIGLATAFRREILAEGVETIEHGKLLLQLGCECAQGYGIARPMPAADFPAWFATWRSEPAWINQAPVSRQDLPLIYACVEHRAWIKGMDRYLRGEQRHPPELEAHRSQLGKWLASEGVGRRAHHSVLSAVGHAYRGVQDLIAELLADIALGRSEQAKARLPALHRLGGTLLDHLQTLIEMNQSEERIARSVSLAMTSSGAGGQMLPADECS